MNNTADYLMGNSNNLTLVIITDEKAHPALQAAAEQPKKRPDVKEMMRSVLTVDANGRPKVQYNVFCAICGYLCNIPMFILNFMFTVLLMARMKVIAATDPSAADLLYGQISFQLSYVLMGYNAILFITNWCFDGTFWDCLIKGLMQIPLFACFGLGAYYAYLNVMPIVANPTAIIGGGSPDFALVYELLLAAFYAIFQLLYIITFWFFLCCF